MSEQGRFSSLPRVEQVDLNAILPDDIIDFTHTARWFEFAEQNPELASEMLRRAYTLSRTAENSLELCKGVLDLVTFAASALAEAMRRTTSVGVGAEDQQPSGVPYDGQPADEPYQAPPDL